MANTEAILVKLIQTVPVHRAGKDTVCNQVDPLTIGSRRRSASTIKRSRSLYCREGFPILNNTNADNTG
jgi:hypothetical protein